MASHGIPRTARQQQSDEARKKELEEITRYQHLVDAVQKSVDERDFSPELLERTGALLQRNPEYYTIWNVRRRIYANEFENIDNTYIRREITEDSKISQILDIIKLDLQFLFPLLLKFPKCYWIWNHRRWLLEQSSDLLPVAKSRAIWQEELNLVGKMLTRDSRNYHGWGYRRFIIKNLEDPQLDGTSLAQQEYDYTTKMIGQNLSNFSAWHNRSKLILRILSEGNAGRERRQAMLEDELKLIHEALFDPYDQSLWFFHQWLMSTFDPERVQYAIAPELTTDEKLTYLDKEKAFIEEILEDVDDCKWAYQALMSCVEIEAKLRGSFSDPTKKQMLAWLQKLKQLDPLREGRWLDIEARMS